MPLQQITLLSLLTAILLPHRQKAQLKKSDFIPAKIFDFGATQSFAALKNNEIDAWIYFIGHPNAGHADLLSSDNFKIISLESENKKLPIDRKNFPKNKFGSEEILQSR